MKCKTKNISMFFAHAISLSLCAILMMLNGCAGINSAGPNLGKEIETPMTMDAELLGTENEAETWDESSMKPEDPEMGLVTQNEAENLIEPSGASESVVPETSDTEKTILISEHQKSGDLINPASMGSASVNRIEFSGLSAGKSVVTVGTTDPIRYEIKEMQDMKILLQLFDTFLPEHHKRPLITDRFESAVDRIQPIQTASMKDSVLSIELREKVGYHTDQAGNILQIYFNASAIPPKPLEGANFPPSGAMMAQSVENSRSSAKEDIQGQESVTLGGKNIVAEAEILGVSEVMESFKPDKRYTGEKIALDFFETDIRNVFRILREVSGKNFAIDRDVTGTVTLTLEQPVPWDQILDLILKMNQLGKVEEGDVVRIARMETITQEQQDRQDQIAAIAKLREEEKAVEPLMTEYFPINYSDATVDILPKLQLISTKDRGLISVDTRTNMVIMTDTAEKIQHAGGIIQRLDTVTPQVIIEARIVEVTSDFSREIGIEWGVRNSKSSDTLGGIWGYDSAVNLPAENPTGSIGFDFSRLTGSPLLIDARLTAAESQGEGKIVSAPKVMTLNNKLAVIKQGREIPYSVIGSDGMVQTEFKEVDLRLEVTPHVTPDDRITLRILITKNEVADLFDGIPSLSTKQAETELLVNDGETIVIGGILVSNELDVTDSVPGLSKVPVLKWLFKRDLKTSRKEELLIFLTPKIMRLEQKNMLSQQN